MLKNTLLASLFCLCLFGFSYGQSQNPPTSIPAENPPPEPVFPIFEIKIPLEKPEPNKDEPKSEPSQPKETPKRDPWEGLRNDKKPD